MPWKPAKMVRFLLKHGFIEEPKSGGHRSFYNPETGKSTEVPMHGKELKKGTETDCNFKRSRLKQMGLISRLFWHI